MSTGSFEGDRPLVESPMSNAVSHVVKLTPAAHAVSNALPIVEKKASLSVTPDEMLDEEEAIMKAALGNAKDARAAVKEAATKKEVKKKGAAS